MTTCVANQAARTQAVEGKVATFVTITEPKNLDEAIAKARKAKASKYYSKKTNKKSYQKKVKEELENLSPKIEQIALNYTTLIQLMPKYSNFNPLGKKSNLIFGQLSSNSGPVYVYEAGNNRELNSDQNF
ncbi:17882_t:CDS:2 [Gigaspora margarita]|uniref:17882_t:CDS:1 n=1 Tax=Gigaspora margarita TaxID=4874 RepID=A0ABN7UN91_GIGMA|nr:17882_t:CDS:2 [Gigaspora margarita]